MPTIDEIKDLLERVRQKHLLTSREETKEVTRPSPLPPMSPFSCTPNAGRVNIIKVIREEKTEKKIIPSKELTDEVLSNIRFSGH